MEGAHFETFPGEGDGKHYWRLKAANGQTIAVGEGYSSEGAAEEGIEAVKRGVLSALGINPRNRILVGLLEVEEVHGGEADGELRAKSSPNRCYVEVDPDAELPL